MLRNSELPRLSATVRQAGPPRPMAIALAALTGAGCWRRLQLHRIDYLDDLFFPEGVKIGMGN